MDSFLPPGAKCTDPSWRWVGRESLPRDRVAFDLSGLIEANDLMGCSHVSQDVGVVGGGQRRRWGMGRWEENIPTVTMS